jgi:hypothetical protein
MGGRLLRPPIRPGALPPGSAPPHRRPARAVRHRAGLLVALIELGIWCARSGHSTRRLAAGTPAACRMR